MIGIISDTHEQVEKIVRAVEIFKQKKVDFVVHCGDLISPGTVLEAFKGLKMKIINGNNNCDQETYDKRTLELGFEDITQTKEFEYLEKNFFVIHGHQTKMLDDAIKSQRYDYILTGHTHKKRDEKIGKTRIINPGSLFMPLPTTIATLDVKKDKLEFIEIK